MRALISLCLLALLGCKVEPLFEGVPAFAGSISLIKDRPVSSGAILTNLVIEPPDGLLSFPTANVADLPGGNDDPGPGSDIHLALLVNYAVAGVQGANKAGDFVPYLIIEAFIENLDTGAFLTTFLVPHVSTKNGFRYGRNIALVDSIGVSAAGYKVVVKIVPPALVSDDVFPGNSARSMRAKPVFTEPPSASDLERSRSPLSPGVAYASDFAPFLSGTVFSLNPVSTREFAVTELQGAFTLADFQAAADEGSEAGGSGQVGYSY